MGGGTECGESVEELADKARRSLDIFSVKKVATVLLLAGVYLEMPN